MGTDMPSASQVYTVTRDMRGMNRFSFACEHASSQVWQPVQTSGEIRSILATLFTS